VALLLSLPRSNDNHLRHPLARLPLSSPPPPNMQRGDLFHPISEHGKLSRKQPACNKALVRASFFLKQRRSRSKEHRHVQSERERQSAQGKSRGCVYGRVLYAYYTYTVFFYRTETAISYETKSQSLASVANWSHPTAGKPITRFTLLYLEASDDVHVRSGCAHKDTGSTTESAF
jgi:hypothetical protein